MRGEFRTHEDDVFIVDLGTSVHPQRETNERRKNKGAPLQRSKVEVVIRLDDYTNYQSEIQSYVV